MRKDSRSEVTEILQKEEKEKMFAEHIEKLSFKKRMRFREMLDEIGELTLNTAWKKVRSLIKDDPRYDKFSSSDRVKSDLLFFKNVLFYFIIFFLSTIRNAKKSLSST